MSRAAASSRPRTPFAALAFVAAVAVALAALALAAPARAELLEPNSFTATTTSDQASAHPDLTVSWEYVADEQGVVSEHQKDVVVDLPPGLVGAPTATPQCTLAGFSSNLAVGNRSCPADSQVGTASLTVLTDVDGNKATVQSPVYSLVPAESEVTRLAFSVGGVYGIQAVASVRPGDFGVRTTVRNASSLIDVSAVSLTIWGVPADPSHDPDRGAWCIPFCFGGGLSAGVEPKPFLTNPTSCGVAPTARLHVSSWENRARFNADGSPDLSDPNWDSARSSPGSITGCERLSFQPTLSVRPTVSRADSPSGYVVDLRVPQNDNPDGLATAHLRRAEVTLPRGVTLSPSAADGLRACTGAQVGLGTSAPPACPRGSKVGEAGLITPVLPDPLRGDIYLGGPRSGPITEPPYRIFVTLAGNGVRIKLRGSVVPDPATGRLTTTFDDNPQQPFSELKLTFFGGSRASLANPRTCGTKTADARLTPWSAPQSGPPAPTRDSFVIASGPGGGPCPPSLAARPFSPGLSAGLVNPAAGTSSPFVLRLTRPDGHQEIRSLEVSTPEGISAVLRGTPRCPGAAAAAGTCPASSRIGSAVIGSGSGSHPFYVRGGSVYLSGPYKGAPLSLAIEVPAIAGPFDLGTVIVRAAIFVDPTTAALTIKSDPLPFILKGIPLRVRDIRIRIDRPGFMSSPTDCSPSRVGVIAHSALGATARLAERFQVGGCGALDFSPKMTTEIIGGRKAAKRSVNPGLEATLDFPTSGPAQANAERVALRLPKVIFLDQANTTDICTRAQYAAEACPKESIYGHATAISPLLNRPLSGPVYLRSSNHTLPDLVADLNGIVDIDLVGRIDTVKRAMRTTFERVPDVPVSHFELQIAGGPGGLLVNSKNLCKGKSKFGKKLVRKARKQKRKARRLAKRAKQASGKRARQLKHEARRHKHKAKQQKRRARKHTRAYRSKVKIDGQNGATSKQRPKMKANCKRKGKGHKGGKGGKGKNHKRFHARVRR